MQAIKMILSGNFWDSHVYAGKLYLFRQDGELQTVDWDRLISEYISDDDLMLAMKCAFSQSNYLYHRHFDALVRDAEIFPIIVDKFRRLNDRDLQLGPEQYRDYVTSQQDTPFPFPHADARIYAKRMFVASHVGLHEATCGRGTKFGVSTKTQKRWDCSSLAISPYSNALAIAAGNEGLFEYKFSDSYWEYPAADGLGYDSGDIRNITSLHCNGCDWSFYSIFGKSHLNNGFLADFDVTNLHHQSHYLTDDRYSGDARHFRTLSEVVSSQQLFGEPGFAWASNDKIYQWRQGRITVLRYRPWYKFEEQHLEPLAEISIQPWKGEVVSAAVAVFGTVIEFDNAIVLHLSNGEVQTIPGEPVRWRVFPRSRNYENQLHIVYDDRLEIWSFNHDYFVNQDEKALGIKPFLK